MKKNLSGYGLAPGFCPRHEQLSSIFCFSFPAFVKMLGGSLGQNPSCCLGRSAVEWASDLGQEFSDL